MGCPGERNLNVCGTADILGVVRNAIARIRDAKPDIARIVQVRAIHGAACARTGRTLVINGAEVPIVTPRTVVARHMPTHPAAAGIQRAGIAIILAGFRVEHILAPFGSDAQVVSAHISIGAGLSIFHMENSVLLFIAIVDGTGHAVVDHGGLASGTPATLR